MIFCRANSQINVNFAHFQRLGRKHSSQFNFVLMICKMIVFSFIINHVVGVVTPPRRMGKGEWDLPVS